MDIQYCSRYARNMVNLTQCRLAAILAADVVGFSKFMGEDKTNTLAALRELRNDLFQPKVVAHCGDIVKSMGVGWLAAFSRIFAIDEEGSS
jgi:class 3 adenylate cyclase